MRALIVDDHKLFVEAVRPALEQMGMERVGHATTAKQGLESARRERPDLVFVDLGLPDSGGLGLGARIREEVPEAKVVVLTALNSPRAVEEALGVGLHGYLTKDTTMKQFESSVRAVLDGEVVVPCHQSRPSTGEWTDDDEAALLADGLTTREREVLGLLAEGASSEQIARHLSVSRHTVRSHVHGILSKLQVHSRTEAAAFAVRHRLVPANGSSS
jgi:DNA-binding NarL/FixJ family response regulator